MSDERSRREVKADEKAARAREKSLRPWYQKKRFIIPLALLALIVLASVLTTGDGDDLGGDTDQAAGPQEAPSDEEMAQMGSPVQDGKFEFTVTNFECGETEVGPEGFSEQAQGQFCIVTMTVENIGNESQSLFADNQLLIDAEEREFSADSVATVMMEENETFFSEINPGNSLEGQVVFDVPEDAEIVAIELHDSAFSGGVLVDVSS